MSDFEYIEKCRRLVEERCRDKVNACVPDNEDTQEIRQRYFNGLIEHEAHRLAFPVWMGFHPDLEDIIRCVRWEGKWMP